MSLLDIQSSADINIGYTSDCTIIEDKYLDFKQFSSSIKLFGAVNVNGVAQGHGKFDPKRFPPT